MFKQMQIDNVKKEFPGIQIHRDQPDRQEWRVPISIRVSQTPLYILL